MSEHTERLRDLGARIDAAKGFLGVDAKRAQIADLQAQASDPRLWDDAARGQQVTSKLSRVKADVDRHDALQRRVEDALAIDELLEDEAGDR